MRLLGLLCIVLGCACGSSSSSSIADTGVVDATTPDAVVDDAAVPDAAIPDASPPPDAFFPTGNHTQYVVDAIDIPASASEANACGLNIDGDDQARVDNALGQVIAALVGSSGANPQGPMDQAIANGTALHLFDVQADSLVDDPGVLLRTFFGEDTDGNLSDNFSGSETFDVAADSPTMDMVNGPLSSGSLTLGPGNVSLRMVPFPGGSPVVFPLVGARITGDITAGTITNGILGGAVTSENVDSIIIPALAANVQAIVAGDCGGTAPDCCDPGTGGDTLVSLFDTNSDCLVSVDEIRNNALIASLVAPDVDLFDASGAFNPRQDGVNDSLSVGVCFTAVGASFVLP